MKYLVIAITCFFLCDVVSAQSTAGLTGQRDTSYSNYSAYTNTKKTHPNIKLITEFKNIGITEARNLVYTRIAKRELLTDVFIPKKKIKTTILPSSLFMVGVGVQVTAHNIIHWRRN